MKSAKRTWTPRAIASTTVFVFGALLLTWASACAAGDDPEVQAPTGQDVVPKTPETDAAVNETEAGPPPCTADFCPVVTNADARVGFYAIWGTAKNDVWAAGTRGTVSHFDGASWTTTSLGIANAFFSIGGSSANDVYLASTNRRFYRTTGFTDGGVPLEDVGWSEGLSTTGNKDARVWSLVTAADGTVIAAGDPLTQFTYVDDWTYYIASVSLRVSEGTTDAGSPAWRPITCLDQSGMGGAIADCYLMEIRAVWGTSASDLIAVGKDGRIRRIQGLTPGGDGSEINWSTVESGTQANLTAIWGTSTGSFLIVGDRGTLLRSDGYTATPIDVGTKMDLRAIWGSGPNDLWVVGERGTIFHFDGQAWQQQTVGGGADQELFGVWGTYEGDVWVAGDGVILRKARAK